MQRFFFNEKNKTETLNRATITALEKYNHRDYNAEKFLQDVLDNCIVYYKENGTVGRETELLSLKTELTTAQRGINPRTLEKVSVRRNEMQSITTYKVLQTLSEIMRMELEKISTTLNDAKILVGQIILAAIQGGLLDDAKIKAVKKQTDIEKMWNSFSVDANLSLAQKKVQMQVSRPDIIILCDELLAQIKTQE